MNKYAPYFDQFAIDQLKLELLKKIGWSISNKPDCAQLSYLIFKSGCGQISESTLYRLFFQVNKHRPYKNTLDILCRYLGYSDSIEFNENLIRHREALNQNGIYRSEGSNKSLLFTCIEHTAKRPLIHFFEEVNEYNETIKRDIGVSVFDSLLISSQQPWFFQNFARQPFIRQYFFEKNHDPKFRIPNYDKAYSTYLKGLKPEKDVNNLQDFIFGNAVLFRFYYLTKKYENAFQISKSIYEINLSDDLLRKELYIFPYIRFLAYKLWYLGMTNASFSERENYAHYLIISAKKLKKSLPVLEQRIIMHTIAETFVHSNISEQFHWELKLVFADLYHTVHPTIKQKHLKYSLPYYCENGLLNFRP